jgi:hypothetical protein
MEKKSNYQGVKLPDHPVRTRQAQGAFDPALRETRPEYVDGFPGTQWRAGYSKEVSLIVVPLYPGYKGGSKARSSKYGFSDEKIGDAPYSFLSPFSAIL